MLSEKIAKEFLKKSAELQHLRCSCDGCAKRLAVLIVDEVALEMKPTEQNLAKADTRIGELLVKNGALHAEIDELKRLLSEASTEPGTTYLAGTPVEPSVAGEHCVTGEHLIQVDDGWKKAYDVAAVPYFVL